MKKEQQYQTFNWIKRRSKSLGVVFSDHVSLGYKSSSKTPKVSEWQEALLPLGKIEAPDKQINTWATTFLGLLVTLILFSLVGRLVFLEGIKGQYYLEESLGNTIREMTIPAPRGIIYDRNGLLLANNIPGFRLVVDTSGVLPSRINRIADTLSAAIGETPANIKLQLDNRLSSEIVLQSGLTQDQALRYEVQFANYSEIQVQAEPVRNYPNNETLAQLIGYVGQITAPELSEPQYAGYSSGAIVGRSGIEAAYEYLLHGTDGHEIVGVDSQGRVIQVYNKENPIPGHNIYLTVDLKITEQVGAILQKELPIAHTNKAAVIALNPSNGEVLTYISEPSFDPNLFSKGITEQQYQTLINDPAQPLFDRVISGIYPPGSTFKPTVAIAALSNGVTTPTREINSPPVIYLGTQAFHNWATYSLGNQDLAQALAWSNDIYFYTMGGELGIDRLAPWAKKLGFGEKTGINLPGEASGLVPTPAWKEATFGQPWYPGDNYNTGIGQGYLLVTPLQLVLALATIGNGGTLYQPILIKQITDQNSLVIGGDRPIVRSSNLINPQYDQDVKTGLQQACTIYANFGGDTGCKTGTAEYGGTGQTPEAWFSVFAPLQNPQIAMVVLLEGGGEGSVVASPVAKPAFEQYLSPKYK